jgi:hypothetical protein
MTGQLSTQEEIELLQWIKQNPENQAQFLLLQEKLSASHTFDLKPQTTNYWLRFLDKINYPVQTKIIRKNSWRLTIPLVAASLVLGLIIGYLSNYFRDEMPFEYSNMQIRYQTRKSISLAMLVCLMDQIRFPNNLIHAYVKLMRS